jgi:hypothetical protein
MTQITVELPEEVVAGLGGDPQAIARTLADLATERWRSSIEGTTSNSSPPPTDAQLDALYETALDGYDFDAWKELRKRIELNPLASSAIIKSVWPALTLQTSPAI